jgi:hypothetical protein
MEIIIGAVIAVVVAVIVILAYAKGVRTGMRMAKGEEPAKIPLPTMPEKKIKPKKGEIPFEDQLDALKGYEPQFTEE